MKLGVECLKYVLSEVLSRVLEYSSTRPGSSKRAAGRHNVFKTSTGLSTRTPGNGSAGKEIVESSQLGFDLCVRGFE